MLSITVLVNLRALILTNLTFRLRSRPQHPLLPLRNSLRLHVRYLVLVRLIMVPRSLDRCLHRVRFTVTQIYVCRRVARTRQG